MTTNSGATVGRPGIVRLPQSLVDNAIRTALDSVMLYGRDVARTDTEDHLGAERSGVGRTMVLHDRNYHTVGRSAPSRAYW